ncbi:M56 family metallopeptidase [Brevibacillus ruminantium]|uniref:M56 family metallopeptidase n=1 Tax=Brevibacillus ruminantium TaxID=2950604 RepID=A0ABY4WLG3_9BACL|nr:M56 family metallopeptidase [Brevibacillus ruminantium]USG65486.1 M56 family metallopeptidase [Brevibacillus ruminantium]
MDILSRAFLLFVDATFASSAVALVVMVVLKLFRHRLTPRIRHIIWLIVLVRMLVPVLPASPISMFSLLDIGTRLEQSFSAQKPEPQAATTDLQQTIPLPIPPTPIEKLPADNKGPSEERTSDENRIGHLQTPSTYPAAVQIASVVWLTGVIGFMLYLSTFLVRMQLKRKELRLVTEPHILSIMIKSCRLYGLQKPIPVYTGNFVSSPFVSGLFRPYIYLPEGICKDFGDDQLFHIFSHELAHYKRKDIVLNAISSFTLAIHWMNPLAWLSIRQMKAEQELACDAYVLELLGEAEAVPYGMTVIEGVKRYSSNRQPHLLSFYGAKTELERRIHMIKSFKQGSYKLSVAAIACVAVLGAFTLTNASSTVIANSPKTEAVTSEAKDGGVQANKQEKVLFDPLDRTFNNLEKAVRLSDLPFKVPAVLPENTQMDRVSVSREKLDQPGVFKTTSVSISFERNGLVSLYARAGANDVESLLQEVKSWFEDHYTDIKEEKVLLKGREGREVLKATLTLQDSQEVVYVWIDQGIGYQLLHSGNLTEQESAALINSMKAPDQELFSRYVNPDLTDLPVYDTGDLERLLKPLDFTPKLPLQLPGSFTTNGPDLTTKINFSLPENEEDKKSKVFFMFFTSGERHSKEWKRVNFTQIKDNGIYDKVKKEGQIAYGQIDGQPFFVKVTPVSINGREVLKTNTYKIDGTLSPPTDPNLTSYLWKEGDVCYQAMFRDDGTDQLEVVRYLLNEKPVDLNKLRQ